MKNVKKLLFALLAAFISLNVAAQVPVALYDNTKIYREALELFDHEKYVPAKEKFEDFIRLEKNPQHALRINSEYYSGVCALYLLHKDAEYQLEKFVLEHPDSPWKQRAFFELATFNYQKKSYKKALEWFDHVDMKELSNAEKTEFYYKRGHARFEEGDKSNARVDFFEAKQNESEFKQPALYYYSHITYEQGDYQTALEGFLQLENDPVFKALMPYYITQIYYKQKKYDEVLRYGPTALAQAETNATKRVPEIARLIGDSYCIKENYAAALPYLEQYHAATDKAEITREDYYQLGYAYHKTSQWQKAVDSYGNCDDENDELHQRSSYNMGECYLKLEQKEYARNAFEDASNMTFNPEIQEDAMFNYAKLAFELSYNPFHEAITAFEEYLEKYPNSKRRDEAYEFLLNVYMKTRNYERALAALEKIQNKDNRVKEAYQVVAYNRGVELFQAEKFADADKSFDKVFTYQINPVVSADSRFWKAEVSYRLRDYNKAIQRYQEFFTEAGAYNSEFYGAAHYGFGYAYFKKGLDEDNFDLSTNLFTNANTSFRKYVDGSHAKIPKK
ncbi:MAG: tetratricopeptide repeat protein [Flavobacteriales bacterium]|nr:tetratricopeptide repeat protein [Flavobacteriales bacterium]